MECPRCGDDNLPGMSICLGCGRDLTTSPPAADLATVPRVASTNPLERGPQRPATPRGPRIVPAQLGIFRAVLIACLAGLPPGLGAWRRGDRRTGAVLVGLLALCGVLWVLLWTSAIQPFAWVGVLCIVASACLTEARARLELPDITHRIVAVALSLAITFSVHSVASLAETTLVPRVSLADQPNLPGGHFVVRAATVTDLHVDDLVVIGSLPRWWHIGGGGIQVASVLAGPGQTVTHDGQRLLVDGAPPMAHALNPRARTPMVQGGTLVVPPGGVAVYTDPVALLPQERLAGRITYRWLPRADRGPVDWPPQSESP